ncbi:ABC transporter permease, partial [Candidatus Entotheonella palauensis]
MHSLYMAWQYLRFHKVKTVVLIAALTLIIYLPLAVHILVRASEVQMLARSRATPLILGQKGSALDLVMNTLYFASKPPETISMREAGDMDETGLAYAIPMYNRYTARGFPIVGTTLDYFSFRQLEVAAGRMIAVLGECVLGATAAAELGLSPGDALISTPENPFDLAGVYPLKMKVVGVLTPSHTPDDRAVFADVKTAWVIEGLGHGHEDVAATRDPQNVLAQQAGNVVASAKLVQYTEITPANIDSFHFHGDTAKFPLTSVIAVPHDDKSATLLRGRYLPEASPFQMIVPVEVVSALLQNIFKIQRVLNIIFAVVSIAMLLTIILIIMLSLRLRQSEIETMYKLGCSRLKMAELV